MTNGQQAKGNSKKKKRNTFGFVLCALLLAFSFRADAQQTEKMPRLGYLSRDTAEGHKNLLAAFQQGLRELGYVEGKNITVEYRYADRKPERLAELAAELVKLRVDIIVSGAGSAGVRAARKATGTIPIVFSFSADPVGNGIIASLARPGANVTGLSDYHRDLVTKRLELLKEIVPSANRVAILFNPNQRSNRPMLKDLQDAAPAFGVTLLPLGVDGADDIDRAFVTINKDRPGGLLQLLGLGQWRKQIVPLVAKSRLPAIYTQDQWVDAGGLVSYGASWPDLFRRTAIYIDKILKGAKPADLPVEQARKFEMIVNLKTAKQLGLTIPETVLYRADKIIK